MRAWLVGLWLALLVPLSSVAAGDLAPPRAGATSVHVAMPLHTCSRACCRKAGARCCCGARCSMRAHQAAAECACGSVRRAPAPIAALRGGAAKVFATLPMLAFAPVAAPVRRLAPACADARAAGDLRAPDPPPRLAHS